MLVHNRCSYRFLGWCIHVDICVHLLLDSKHMVLQWLKYGDINVCIFVWEQRSLPGLLSCPGIYSFYICRRNLVLCINHVGFRGVMACRSEQFPNVFYFCNETNTQRKCEQQRKTRKVCIHMTMVPWATKRRDICVLTKQTKQMETRRKVEDTNTVRKQREIIH